MDETTRLAEQRILEWESRLKHIDELMERAARAQAIGSAEAGARDRLRQARERRDRLALEVQSLRERGAQASDEVIARSGGLRKMLDLLGQELSNLLTQGPRASAE